mgnify:CR=1 FL=1
MQQELDIKSLNGEPKTNALKIKSDLERDPLNVLFVYTNIDGFHLDNYHFGLATLVSITKNLGHNCKVELLGKKSIMLITKKLLMNFNQI